MDFEVKNVLENFGERIKRLAIYDPLYKLAQKKRKDHSDKKVPYYELGMATLLFFFENMIIRNRNSGVKELTNFLYEINKENIELTLEEFEEVARDIIEVFRPPTGKRNSMSFYNFETGQDEEVSYSILKAARSDLKSNTQYYILDEQGLELIFSTKEYFSEFQISINQLLLRKQLEKGEFIGALRQIDEMHLSVETLRDHMIKIRNEVSRSIVSEQTYDRYKRLIEDINIRLTRENEEFEELQEFVKQTKDGLKYTIENEKDKKAYELILKIDNRLDEVHHEHGKLLQESIVLKTHALEAAQQSLYFIGIDSFNFQNDITNHLTVQPLPLYASCQLVQPFLQLERQRQWLPLNIFAKQRIEKDNDQDKSKAFSEVISEEEINRNRIIIQNNFKKIATYMLDIMNEQNEITLKQICDALYEIDNAILDERLFYDFWIILHQKSPIVLKNLEDESLLSGLNELLSGRIQTIVVEECLDTLKVNQRFTIKNMRICLEE